ncbi:uncharacterized protein LOC135101032 [Scylla paramamosain]|uniref:uncharacterized protein LOC135101032 n=1 Tax=Scylla paramamosain TaxID=85552 RepID=UPI003083D0FD
MSTTKSSSTLLGDVAPMPFTHDLWTSEMVLSRPSNSFTINSSLPLQNSGLFYTPGLLNMSNISVLETQVQLQQQIQPVKGYSLLPEHSAYVRDPANAFPRYHNLPQMVERTAAQLPGQASGHESSSQRPPGNIWDMLVSLLGTEQSRNSAKSAENISTSYLNEECYIGKADAYVTSHQASHSQKQLSVNSYSTSTVPVISTDVAYQNLVRVLESDVQPTTKPSILMMENCSENVYSHLFHTEIKDGQCAPDREEKTEVGPLCASESLSKTPLIASEGRVIVSKSSDIMSNRNNETNIFSIFKRANNVVPVNNREDQLPAASVQITTIMQEKSINPKSSTSMVVKKQQAFQKQRKKPRKTKLYGKVSTEAKNKLFFVKPEAVEEITKEKSERCLSVHPGFEQTAINEQCIEETVMPLPRTVESTSLSKITSINLQCWDEEKEILMWTDTMIKFLNSLPKSERLYSIQVKNQRDESNPQDTVIIKLDAQLGLSLESGFGLDSNVNSIFGHVASLKKNPHITGLLLLAEGPKLQNVLSKYSEVLHMLDSRNIRDEVNSTKPLVKISKSLKVYEGGTSPVCKKSKSLALQVDFTGIVHHDKFMESQEGPSVNSPTQARLQAAEGDSSQSAVTVEETVPPQEQLKLLLHSGHCQLPELMKYFSKQARKKVFQLTKCAVASCTGTKKLLKHSSCCTESSQCPVKHCSVSRALLKHWNFCRIFYCPLCAIVRQPDPVQSLLRSTKRDRDYTTNSNEAKIYAASLVSKGSSNVTKITTTTVDDTTGFDSLSTHSEDQMESSPLRITSYRLEENQRYIATNVYGSFGQAEWDYPFGDNSLGEDLSQISWTMNLEPDDQQLSANDTGSRYVEEGPTLAAGFTLSAQHLRQRLDCLLHSVTCEMPDQETSQECFRKHCSIMKTSMVHMSLCSEFTSCSNVICLLFSPLLSHWKSCCGPCSICGPINLYDQDQVIFG